NTLHEEKTISGLVGEAYDATTSEYQLSIEGYILTGVSDNVKGTLSEKNQEVIYTYIKDLSQVSVHDSEITVGDAWKAEDNFDRAIDESGEEVSFEQIIVTGQVDTNTAGSYKVHYQLPKTIESRQSATEAIATITVLPKD
ncbi:bacterial Ig-like domain-containing protein, partial [Enterococcus phoeniculicola]